MASESNEEVERDVEEGGSAAAAAAAAGDVGLSNGTLSIRKRLSPAARLFHAPKFNCYILAIFGCKTAVNPKRIKTGLSETLLQHPRFSSKMVGDLKRSGKMKWVPTTVNLDDHVIVPDIDPNQDSPDRFVEDYISYITTSPLDTSRPLWELHLLNIKTSDAESVGVFRIHHSMGDGASLMSLLLACTRKTSDPESLPTVPEKTRAGTRTGSGSTGLWWFVLAVWMVLRMIWNSFVDILVFLGTLCCLKDTETPIKGKPGVGQATKRFVHRIVSLDDVKLVKNELHTTINDVLLGVTQAGLSRYVNRIYAADENNDEHKKKSRFRKRMRLSATILINLRPAAGIQALSEMMAKKSKTRWGNWIGYILLPFSITPQDDPLEYVRQAKANIDRKKLSLEAVITFAAAQILLKIFGAKVAGAIAHRILMHTTLAFSNVVGPLEEISFYGHPIAYIVPSVYGHPQAITIHFQSYVDKMIISLAVDPEVVPDPYLLCDDFEESLKTIKDAVVAKGPVSVRDVEPVTGSSSRGRVSDEVVSQKKKETKATQLEVQVVK